MNNDNPRVSNKLLILLALLSGLLNGLAFPPIPLGFFAFFSFVPLLFVLDNKDTLKSFYKYAYLSILVFNIISLYWIGSWTPEADPFLMISGALMILFHPILFMIPITFYYFARKRFGRYVGYFLFPFIWVGFEYLYSVTEFRFPWLKLGYTQSYYKYIIQIADIIGVYGISFVLLLINVFIFIYIKEYIATKKHQFVYPLGALTLFAIIELYGIYQFNYKLPYTKDLTVGVVQPNLNPWNKWEKGNLMTQLKQYISLSDSCYREGAEIVIWPETALPVYFNTRRYRYERSKVQDFCDSTGVSIITGMPIANFLEKGVDEIPFDAKPLKGTEDGFYTSYNSIITFEPGKDRNQQYGKIKLVPFGEKVPYVEYIPILGDILKWNVGISSWNTGQDTVVFNLPYKEKRVKVGGVICIESIYPDFVAQFVQKGAEFLTVVTNDSWYGYSSGPFQHKQISVLRAVENRRYLVRCANGGISCIVDPFGKISHQTDLFTKTTFTAKIGVKQDLTFYTKNPLLIPGLSVFVLLVIITASLLGWLKNKLL